ncbi:hypothetical protein CDL12_05998 [Handroanthus impetiginosus]|uniref:TNFR-Cys domain-containing protein n=1 Tax=Handroanthus impetiginosus TaxID=429701 RepID=A0A2G9HUW9_9LAMI|nr:hypothetical protein CDL12_05998 [Handroanthus impetiginosus]
MVQISPSRTRINLCLLILILLEMTLPCLGCPSDGSQCRNCIVNQMKTECPGCVPTMQCMARCLWGGTTRSACIKKCDCSRGYPRLGDCKKCLSQCKCSCSASA